MRRWIAIVGVGALGSHVAYFLRCVQDTTILAIDFDTVERKNTLSQFYGTGAVGRKKPIGLDQQMRFLYGKAIATNTNKVTELNAREVLSALGPSDLVIDCLDNGEGRRVVQTTCRALQLPLLHGALGENASLGRAIWDEKFVVDADGTGKATCEDGQQLPFIGVVSAHIAHVADTFLKTGKKISLHIPPFGGVVML